MADDKPATDKSKPATSAASETKSPTDSFITGLVSDAGKEAESLGKALLGLLVALFQHLLDEVDPTTSETGLEYCRTLHLGDVPAGRQALLSFQCDDPDAYADLTDDAGKSIGSILPGGGIIFTGPRSINIHLRGTKPNGTRSGHAELKELPAPLLK